MNRFKLLSGGLAASLLVLVAASAVAQSLESPPAGQWWSTGRTYDLQRYSSLSQINRTTVKNLKASWTFSTGVLNGHEGNPLVINNVMYVHSAFPNIVYALDLTKPGAPMIWKHVPSQPAEAKPIACCDLVNRGVAYHSSGKLFIELLAGDLLALDAKTGKQIWRVPHADYKTGSTMTNAPLVVKDIVIAGISGGEFGVRGRVSGFDVNTGQKKWTMYSTGPDNEVGIEGDANPNYPSHRGKDLGVMNCASGLPAALAPGVAAVLINLFGQRSSGGYRLLFLIAGALAGTSALLIRKIRGVAAVYNPHAYFKERQTALEAWSRYAEAVVCGTRDNIVPRARVNPTGAAEPMTRVRSGAWIEARDERGDRDAIGGAPFERACRNSVMLDAAPRAVVVRPARGIAHALAAHCFQRSPRSSRRIVDCQLPPTMRRGAS